MLLKLLSTFCKFGGPYVAPFVMPLINPFLWSTLIVFAFLPIYFRSINKLNSEDGKNKSAKRSFKFAFIIHYIVCLILLCSIMQVACKVSDEVNPF